MVVLFEETRTDIKIYICASITNQGELLIEGVDSGTLVQKLQGDMDYEYFLSVDKPNKELLMKKLINRNIEIHNDSDLLNWIKENHSGNRAFSSFKTFLESEQIEFKTHFW